MQKLWNKFMKKFDDKIFIAVALLVFIISFIISLIRVDYVGMLMFGGVATALYYVHSLKQQKKIRVSKKTGARLAKLGTKATFIIVAFYMIFSSFMAFLYQPTFYDVFSTFILASKMILGFALIYIQWKVVK